MGDLVTGRHDQGHRPLDDLEHHHHRETDVPRDLLWMVLLSSPRPLQLCWPTSSTSPGRRASVPPARRRGPWSHPKVSCCGRHV